MKSSRESALPLAHAWGLPEESSEKCKGRTGFDPGHVGRGQIGRRGAVQAFWIAQSGKASRQLRA